jgi:hypothetical protein
MRQIIYKTIILSLILISLGIFAVSAQDNKIMTTSSCRLFADVENISSVKSYVPKDTELKVIEFSGEYALVEYKETTGWIRIEKTNAAGTKIQATSNEQEDLNQNNQQSTNYNDRFSILIQKYGYRTGKAIFEHKIWKGMDNNMVKDSWGKPLQVAREVNSSGTVETWTYRKSWLLIKNGILTEWGPNK